LSKAHTSFKVLFDSGLAVLWKTKADPKGWRDDFFDVEEVAIGGDLKRARPRIADYSKRLRPHPRLRAIGIPHKQFDSAQSQPQAPPRYRALDGSRAQRARRSARREVGGLDAHEPRPAARKS
jgi:hypothetical protein